MCQRVNSETLKKCQKIAFLFAKLCCFNTISLKCKRFTYRLTTNFLANYQLTTVILAKYQLAVNPIRTL